MPDKIYKKYGGFSTIRKLVISFYDKVENSELLAGYFANTDMTKQIHHATLFLTEVLGGPEEYEGRSLKDAHKDLSIGEPEFKEAVDLLTRTLKEFGVEEDDIETIMNKISQLKDQIIS